MVLNMMFLGTIDNFCVLGCQSDYVMLMYVLYGNWYILRFVSHDKIIIKGRYFIQIRCVY